MAQPSFDISSEVSGNVLKSFQLTKDTNSKSDIRVGKKLAQYIESTMSGVTSYYWLRNQRFTLNRRWASGKIDIKAMFQDRLDMNGKVNYVNLSWKAIMMVNTIITKEVSKWMGRNEKIVATAIDTLSVKQKKAEYEEAQFILDQKEKLQQLQANSGIPMIPQDQFVADDKQDLDLWASHLQRLPEEILYEEGTNDILKAAGMFDDVKDMMLHDSAECGFVGTYVWMDEQGIIHPEWVKAENAIYSYSEYNDLRDTTWRGRVVSRKISEIRAKYGVEFGGTLTEEKLFNIATLSKEWQMGDKITWIYEWTVAYLRPYDEWNVDCIEFELKTVDSETLTVVKTKKNNSTLVSKGRPAKLSDNEEIVEDKKWNIYRGVYVRGALEMLEWGLKKNMIRPGDPKEIGNCEFSYSYYIPQNRDMRNIAIPEKVEEPAEMLILIRLKMQQLIAKMRPIGAAINVDAIQELDYGLGEDSNKDVDPKKYYDQTGDIYYRGKDAEGNPIPIPITELQNSGFFPQMQGLIAQYEFQHKVIMDELGQDPNLVSQASRPRVSEGNIQVSMQENDNATSHFYDAYLFVMEQTANKIGCLLKDSIQFGAAAYRHLMKQEDIGNKYFKTRLDMLPTEMEIQRLDNMMNQAQQANPDLILYLDTFKILRIAREDIKLAEAYFRQSMKKMLQAKQEEAAKNQQANIDSQQASAQGKAQGDQQLQLMESEAAQLASLQDFVQQLELQSFILGKPLPPQQQALVDGFNQAMAGIQKIDTMAVQNHLRAVMQQQQIAAQQQAQDQAQQQPQSDQGQDPAQQQIPEQQSQAA